MKEFSFSKTAARIQLYIKINSFSSIFVRKKYLEEHLWLLMATFGISKELVIALNYYYEKKHKASRTHVEIKFAF